jgi:glucan-binding YG repeat protein
VKVIRKLILKESAFIMRKQTKLVAVLSAAALLAIGASMTSMAAQGWQQEGDDWYYYDNNGDYVTDEWKKSGNNWYYLGDDGYMMKNYLLTDENDNVYYLDGNGVMVTNAWVAVAPDEDDDDDDTPDHYWYYFQSNGRAVRQTGDTLKKKTINGKTYGFDEDGKMLYGFVTEAGEKQNSEDNPFMEADYYFGTEDDGAMHQGWLQYMDGSDEESAYLDYNDLTELWFYYNPSNGKVVKPSADDGEDIKTKTINGNKYTFDANGVMISGWLSSDSNARAEKYFNGETEGWMSKNRWVYAIPDASINDEDNDEENYRWFYVDGSGETVKNQIKKVKASGNKKYAFDASGIMKVGFVVANADDDTYVSQFDTDTYTAEEFLNLTFDNGNALYYFNTDEETDGAMRTGKNISIELSDDTYTFGFEKSGEAINALDSNKIYVNGLLVKAEDGSKYQAINDVTATETVTINAGKDDEAQITSRTKSGITDADISALNLDDAECDNYVVSENGTIVKPGKKVKDDNDNYYAVNEDGDIAYFTGDDASKAADVFRATGAEE